ncbi:MAG TPA: hypothetical protein VJC17_04755 [Candidatus Dojkabacteria bacterium]|nr:hypothetical protein [Candidatus Dojkabacteria bacterium]
MALIFIWFGLLKIFGLSPASLLVFELYTRTVTIIPFTSFYAIFATYEVVIGLLFLFPKLTKLAFVLMTVHLFTTVLPLVLLPALAWNGFLVPTLEGQYIIKNAALFALGLLIYSAHHQGQKN